MIGDRLVSRACATTAANSSRMSISRMSRSGDRAAKLLERDEAQINRGSRNAFDLAAVEAVKLHLAEFQPVNFNVSD